MKIGIGIDTGGTCTDAVVYQFENHKILAYAKTVTTKDNLSIGIGNALDGLPRDLVDKSEVIALSTTLATNACVEGKGGRAKLVMFGINPDTVRRVGNEYGLSMDDDSLVFIDSKTKPSGEIVEPPDWNAFMDEIHERFDECDALGVVEMYARKTGAELEQEANNILADNIDIPVVLGNQLFDENNIVKRGASALLNARLIPVINEFLNAVKKALEERNIKAPFVIVRSDGSLMTGAFTATRPVETLLCGPVASVMGAVELSGEKDCMIVDIGGTTTDIAFVKNGVPQRVKYGIRIGKWNTFVKGLFVDTFGLGGDSGVYLDENRNIALSEEKAMPLCMAAKEHPSLLKLLGRENEKGMRVTNQQKEIYLCIKDISQKSTYTEYEQDIVRRMKEPISLENLGHDIGEVVLKKKLDRLIREGVIIRCGVTPTDVMHYKKDFVGYDRDASVLGIEILSRVIGKSLDETADLIYDEVKRKLYFNIVRILIEDAYPEIRKSGLGQQLEMLIDDSYYRAKAGECNQFMGLSFHTPAVLVGVGAPTYLFLEDVARLLNTKGWLSEYSKVANALGAVVGKVSATMTMEVIFNQETNTYFVLGCGERLEYDDLDAAKEEACRIASEKAVEEAVNRGAELDTTADVETQEDIVETNFGSLYMGFKAIATANGNLRLA